MRNSFKTPKGTELTLLNLRGKEYLEVKFRLVWFVEERPNWSIETEALSVTENAAYFKATIRDEAGRVRSTAHKFESAVNFPDYREKAETSAIGRALALIGFGTQFCSDELDEGERIVDAPVETKPKAVASERVPAKAVKVEVVKRRDDKDAYEFSFGKFKGKKFEEIDVHELSSYAEWLTNSKGTFTGRLRQELPIIIRMIEEFLKTREFAR